MEQRWSWRRLWRLGQKSAHRTPVMEHSSEPPGAGATEGGARNSLTVAVTGPQGRTWLPGQGLLPVWVGRTVSQRRAVDTWVVEGTEVLVSTVALFGEVSADGAARFVFHNLGSILGWAGILDKRPAFEPSRISLFFVKASPGGTPMAWPRKRRLGLDPPPTTTIRAKPGAEASLNWASAPGRRWETQQWWDHWSPGSWRTSVKS